MIEFGFLMSWSIMWTSEDVSDPRLKAEVRWMTRILLDLHNSSHPTQPHSIIAIWPVDFTEKHKWKQKMGLN